MNLHEYQGKELLAKFGITIQRGKLAHTVEEAAEGFKQLQAETGTKFAVVKAQVHAGGRGKGGGVKLAKNLDEVKVHAANILGMMLKTPQTPGGLTGPRSLGLVPAGTSTSWPRLDSIRESRVDEAISPRR